MVSYGSAVYKLMYTTNAIESVNPASAKSQRRVLSRTGMLCATCCIIVYIKPLTCHWIASSVVMDLVMCVLDVRGREESIVLVDTVFTIGYAGFIIRDFIKVLKVKAVSLVIDVRSLPYSPHYVDYNKEYLNKILNENGIYYRNYALEFGARQSNPVYYPNGYLDFALFSQSERFLSGVERLEKSMQKKYVFALLCSEKDPVMCHRTILVARTFHNLGYKVVHLLPMNRTMTQMDIEEQLLDKFFPDRNQINIFEESRSIQEYVDEAYKRQNALIGYTLRGENP